MSDEKYCTGCGRIGELPEPRSYLSCCPERKTISIPHFVADVLEAQAKRIEYLEMALQNIYDDPYSARETAIVALNGEKE